MRAILGTITAFTITAFAVTSAQTTMTMWSAL